MHIIRLPWFNQSSIKHKKHPFDCPFPMKTEVSLNYILKEQCLKAYWKVTHSCSTTAQKQVMGNKYVRYMYEVCLPTAVSDCTGAVQGSTFLGLQKIPFKSPCCPS